MEGRRRVGQPGRWLTPGLAVGWRPGKSGLQYRLRAGPSLLGEVAEPMLPGKASKRVACVPVPKPTQVGEWRTLRRSSELWLRNSANCPRNFGRRGALDGVGLRAPSCSEPQRRGPGDCLPKTQVSAKSKRRCIGADACPMPER